jgi:hypothetical protein
MDKLNIDRASLTTRNTHIQAQADANRKQKRRQVKANPGEMFINAQQIMAARDNGVGSSRRPPTAAQPTPSIPQDSEHFYDQIEAPAEGNRLISM